MPEDIVSKRGKRAAYVLFTGMFAGGGLAAVRALMETTFRAGSEGSTDSFLESFGNHLDTGYARFFFIFCMLVYALNNNMFKTVRVLFMALCALSVLDLYFALSGGPVVEALLALSNTAVYALALIALFKLGKTGKKLCYTASALSAVSLVLSFVGKRSGFDLIISATVIVFFVFFGQYVDSRGMPAEKPMIERPR